MFIPEIAMPSATGLPSISSSSSAQTGQSSTSSGPVNFGVSGGSLLATASFIALAATFYFIARKS